MLLSCLWWNKYSHFYKSGDLQQSNFVSVLAISTKNNRILLNRITFVQKSFVENLVIKYQVDVEKLQFSRNAFLRLTQYNVSLCTCLSLMRVLWDYPSVVAAVAGCHVIMPAQACAAMIYRQPISVSAVRGRLSTFRIPALTTKWSRNRSAGMFGGKSR